MARRAERGGAEHLAASARTELRRMRERGTHQRSVVESILDEGLLCHVGVLDGDTPVVSPMAYANVDGVLYLHGAPANRVLALLGSGVPACVTVTLLDGLVLARSAFHHSMNFRSVMLFGLGTSVEDSAEKVAASAALLEHLARGRSTDARAPTPAELLAKVRNGGPKDEPEDLGLSVWAGVIPFRLVAGAGVAEPGLPPGTPTPPYAVEYPDREAGGSFETPESPGLRT